MSLADVAEHLDDAQGLEVATANSAALLTTEVPDDLVLSSRCGSSLELKSKNLISLSGQVQQGNRNLN